MSHLVRQLLEESGARTYTLNKVNEFAITCPKCGDSEHHMYVNPVKLYKGVKGWCYCHRRGCTMTLEQLLRHFGIKGYKIDQVEYKPTTYEMVKSKLMNIGNFDFCDHEEVKVIPTGFDFDQFKIPYRKSSDMAKRAMRYLTVKRGFTDEQIEQYGLRYSDSGDYSGRIIIPFYENEELVYFQARGFTIATSNKILNPPLGAFSGGKSDYLFNFDQAKLHRTVIINEGWASSITAGYNAVAINGNKASDVQLTKLTNTWDSYIVMLDNGVEVESFKLAKELLYRKSNARLKLILLPNKGTDPNDCDPKYLDYLIQKAKIYKTKAELDMDEIRILSEKV